MAITKSVHQQFREEGYIIFPGVFKGQQLENLLAACNYVLAQFTEEQQKKHPNSDFNQMRHLNDPRWHLDTKTHLKTILEAVADPRCLGPVEQIFDGPSLFRTISLFVNPLLSRYDGDWHRDSQFMTRDEQHEREILEKAWRNDHSNGFALQFQIALVDNDDIEFVPFSVNRYDSPEEAYIRLADNKSHHREDGMPNAMRIALKAGDAVIFNPYGLHRGRYYKEIPRRTLMLTYTPVDHPFYDFFTDQPWFENPGYLDGLSPRAIAYFQQFAETFGDFWANNRSQK